jgi:hypothetical protein
MNALLSSGFFLTWIGASRGAFGAGCVGFTGFFELVFGNAFDIATTALFVGPAYTLILSSP